MAGIFRGWIFCLIAAGSWNPCTLPAQENSENLAALYVEGTNALRDGDYKKAAANMETIIAKALPTDDLEQVYYTLGAAWINQEEFSKGIAVLTQYLAKYPRSVRIQDAVFSIGDAQYRLKDYKAAAQTLASLHNHPKWGEQALTLTAASEKEAGNPRAAISLLQKLIAGGVRTPAAADGAMLLAELYLAVGDSANAISLLKTLYQNPALLGSAARLNAVAVGLGDTLLQQQKPAEALACYRFVQSKPEVERLARERMAALERKIATNLQEVRADPKRTMEVSSESREIKRTVAQIEADLALASTQPDYEGPLLQRIAQAYNLQGRRWEAIAVYDEALRRKPEAKEKESALFGLIVASVEAGRLRPARESAEAYLRDYPQGENASSVGYLMGASALQTGDLAGAEKFFGRMMNGLGTGSLREESAFLLANSLFGQAKYDEAALAYQKYLAEYPAGSHAQESDYRIALARLFAGKYQEAMETVSGYLARYPAGEFRADAKYRLAVCKYAASLYPEVLADCDAWQEEFPGRETAAEVLALKADALAGLDRNDEAIDAYLASYEAATVDDVLNYSLFEAANLMQKRGQWERLASVFEKFLTDRPDHPSSVTAAYWVGRAKAKEGKPEEAKSFVAGVVRKNLGDRTRPATEQLISQLARMCVRKKSAPGALSDPGVEIESLLGASQESVIAKARVFFAKAELARLRRDPVEEDKNLQAIVETAKPADLSDALLAQVGDYLLRQQDLEKAAAYFECLQKNFPASDFLDFAWNGLGEAAYAKGDFANALSLFDHAITAGLANAKLKEITVGQAKTLLALGRLEEAKMKFEEIASIREWRGEATAFSVYSLGEIEQKLNRLPEAIAYYQRVYVAYRKYLPWVAKAYAKSAECFQKLGKNQDALNTYREMLRNEKLTGFTEFEEARKQVEAMGNG